MKNNNEELFLTWFFKGRFFSKIKKNIESELNTIKSNKHFINFLFNGDDNIAESFLIKYKKKKNESTVERNHRILNLSEMNVLNEMLIGDFYYSDAGVRRLHKWNIAMSVHSTATLESIYHFLHDQYINFRNSESCRKYILSLGVMVCPYCDKSIIDCTSDYFYGDLDHKKDKSGQYFYLSLNMHNLSPCCKVCNQHKGVKILQFDPARHQLDELFRFTLDKKAISSLSSTYNPDDIKIGVSVTPEYEKYYVELNNAVKLSDRYKNMHSIAAYLYQIKRVMNQEWIGTINDLLGKDYSAADIEKFILANYTWNGSDKIQPLTKLIKDLAEELKLFK